MEPKNVAGSAVVAGSATAEGIELDLEVGFEELEQRLAPWGFIWFTGETVHPY